MSLKVRISHPMRSFTSCYGCCTVRSRQGYRNIEGYMRKIFTILISFLMISCTAIAESPRDQFYIKNSGPINSILSEVSPIPSSNEQGVVVSIPLLMKTKVSRNIEVLTHTPEGILINVEGGKISFLREMSKDVFFTAGKYDLLEIYSDLFKKDKEGLWEKYSNDNTAKYGISDFKLGLQISTYAEKGYFTRNNYVVFFLIGGAMSEAFILNTSRTNELVRIATQGLSAKEFKALLGNISKNN